MTTRRSRSGTQLPRATPASMDAGVVSFGAEQARRAALAEAELVELRARVELLQRFLRHDARTPLAIVLGHAQMLAEGMIPEGRRGESFEIISCQVRLLGNRMDALGAATPPCGGLRPVWVSCPRGKSAEVRQALAGLPVIVGADEIVGAFREVDEPEVQVADDWAPESLRSAVRRHNDDTLG